MDDTTKPGDAGEVDWFDQAAYEARLTKRGGSLGRPLFVRRSTQSTNDDALRSSVDVAAHGSVFLAAEQTRGRGRHGHAWFSRPGESLTFSLLLRPQWPAERLMGLSLLAGLAVRDALSGRVTTPAHIKWPNDVWLDGKKVAGILIESRLAAQRVSCVVIGIGLNVTTAHFPEELSARSTSLVLSGARDVALAPLLADVIAALDARLQTFGTGMLESLALELAHADALKGRRVSVDGVHGMARGIDAHGALLIEDDDGLMHAVVSGSVELRA